MPLQTRMEALFDGWKKAFENPGFKFYFVQLSPYNYWFYPDELPEIWEAQEAFAAAHGPEVGMAVINDVGNVNDIHPKDKETVGKRLAMLARKHTYGEKTLKADSPRLVNTRRKANAVRLIFSNVESWRTSDNGPVRHFEIAGSNGIFHPALVKINGRELLVSSDKVAYPVMLRYMWHQADEASLFNEAGLPLGAFRVSKEPDLRQIQAELDKTEQLVFRYDFRTGSGFGDKTKVNYLVDVSDKVVRKFDRVTYLITATTQDGISEWVCVSMNAFTQDAKKIGVPTVASGADFQSNVKELIVRGSAPGLKTGNFSEGNIEFWPMNYSRNNAAGVAGARNDLFDLGDAKDSQYGLGYGSMQIHNSTACETVFSYNNFAGGPNADFGIGNNSVSGQNPDWTFSGNLRNYKDAILSVYVTK